MPNKIKNVVLNEQGAIVVEATISLTAFMFLIVTILTVINICYAQAKSALQSIQQLRKFQNILIFITLLD